MNGVLDFIENIPALLIYVVPGYLFLAVFRFILYRDRDASAKTTRILLNSIIGSFILKVLYDFLVYRWFELSWDVSESRYLFGIFAVSILAGYTAARLVSSQLVKNIFHRLEISRSVHENIWTDILKEGRWLRIWLPSSEQSYYGQLIVIEDHQREPLVLLRCYQLLDSSGKVLLDRSAEPQEMILLNLSKFERIEVAGG